MYILTDAYWFFSVKWVVEYIWFMRLFLFSYFVAKKGIGRLTVARPHGCVGRSQLCFSKRYYLRYVMFLDTSPPSARLVHFSAISLLLVVSLKP